ncbi:hypothetical protein KYI11_10900 [Macrococcoides bohemicum]|uniref:Uncharacterized protein n=1 Tax=Macrococcoides bohemicum TaxID=1903056 RepID=A0AAJ4PAU2_9STAP|nr:hypothetical protein [Macrococcus bohemicus]QYA42091.1 hypothetical protein KYI11_10900 [Macrococcus bohemicus]
MVRRTVETYLCDVCGDEADGILKLTLNINGTEYNSAHCGLDLCEKHMEIFSEHFLHYGVIKREFKYIKAMYSGIELTNKEKIELIEKIRNKSNEVFSKLNEDIKSYENKEV